MCAFAAASNPVVLLSDNSIGLGGDAEVRTVAVDTVKLPASAEAGTCDPEGPHRMNETEPPTDAYLSVVRDGSRARDERMAAFVHLLASRGSWHSVLTFQQFVEMVAEATTRRTLRRVGLPADAVPAEDIETDTLLTFFERCPTIRNDGAIKGWIWSVARILTMREVKRHWSLFTADEVREEIPEPDVVTEDALPAYARQVEERVARESASMSHGLSQVTTLHLVECRPLVDVARILHITPATARQRWLRAKRILQQNLEDLGRGTRPVHSTL